MNIRYIDLLDTHNRINNVIYNILCNIILCNM